MGYSRRLGPPIVSAAVATIAFTSFATVQIVRRDNLSGERLFEAIWPTTLTTTVAVVLVMSLLYRAILGLVREAENREEAAHHEALHDQLTGLPNRGLLEDRLNLALSRFRRDGETSALLLLDLDRFKKVNDTLGHAAGDLLLKQVATRLQSILRETDTVARLGGDEFAIVQTGARGEIAVRRLCGRILEVIGEPFDLEGREARVGVSVGAVLVSKDIVNGAELLRKADITMYRAKASGRDCFRIFSDEMDAAVQRKSRIESRLRRAVESGEGIGLHYQPQINGSGAVVGMESLLRWSDAELGEVAPSEAIPVAEECGLIAALGEAVFRQACRVARDWPDLSFAVNLSPLQFRDPNLPARLRGIATEEGVSPTQMELEITESLLIEHSDICEEAIARLREHGFRIALDDFGTGYSSLSYLRRFPVDRVKLDRSFIASADPDQSIAIIRAAVTLGHAMSLDVLAEGISTLEQEQMALEAGCDALQGNRYSDALPESAIPAFLSHWNKRAAA